MIDIDMNESKKHALLIIIIILSLLPSVLLMKFPTHLSAASVALWLSAIIGYMGIVMLL
jgi:hypothetical protein